MDSTMANVLSIRTRAPGLSNTPQTAIAPPIASAPQTALAFRPVWSVSQHPLPQPTTPQWPQHQQQYHPQPIVSFGSPGYVYPSTRTEAEALYTTEDIQRINATIRYPQTAVENPNIVIDDINKPNYSKWHGRSPRVWLEELKYPVLIRVVQSMNRFPVGRPKTEEILCRYVNDLWVTHDHHIYVDSTVGTPYPLSYSELYIHGLVKRVKNEMNTAAAEEVWTEFREKYGDNIDLTPGDFKFRCHGTQPASRDVDDEFMGGAMEWFAAQWHLTDMGNRPEYAHLQCPLAAYHVYKQGRTKAHKAERRVKENATKDWQGRRHGGRGGRGGRGGGHRVAPY